MSLFQGGFPDTLSKIIILQASSLFCPPFLFLQHLSQLAIMLYNYTLTCLSTTRMHSLLWQVFVEYLLCVRFCCRHWEHSRGQDRQKSSPMTSWPFSWGHQTISNKFNKSITGRLEDAECCDKKKIQIRGGVSGVQGRRCSEKTSWRNCYLSKDWKKMRGSSGYLRGKSFQ